MDGRSGWHPIGSTGHFRRMHGQSPHILMTAPQAAPRAKVVELCLRCGAEMDWRQGTWQCPRCRFKLGCCEGECPND
jgi:hypothetical protein